MSLRWPCRRGDDSGAAVVDFVLVSLVLVPLVLGIMQVALVLHVRNTLTAAAGEGARYAARLDHSLDDGHARTQALVDQAIAGRFVSWVEATRSVPDGVEVVEVRVGADVPPLGLWGPRIHLEGVGHAVKEQAP